MIDSEFERLSRKHSEKGETVKISDAQLDEYFTYHAPKDGQPVRYSAIRAAARQFAQVLVDNTPAGADQSAAIRELRLCVMTANAAIALEPETTHVDVRTHSKG